MGTTLKSLLANRLNGQASLAFKIARSPTVALRSSRSRRELALIRSAEAGGKGDLKHNAITTSRANDALMNCNGQAIKVAAEAEAMIIDSRSLPGGEYPGAQCKRRFFWARSGDSRTVNWSAVLCKRRLRQFQGWLINTIQRPTLRPHRSLPSLCHRGDAR